MIRRIRIDRLDARLRGVSPHRAREIGAALRRELPRGLLRALHARLSDATDAAATAATADTLPSARLGEVRVPAVRIEPGAPAARAAETISAQAVDAVTGRLQGGRKR